MTDHFDGMRSIAHDLIVRQVKDGVTTRRSVEIYGDLWRPKPTKKFQGLGWKLSLHCLEISTEIQGPQMGSWMAKATATLSKVICKSTDLAELFWVSGNWNDLLVSWSILLLRHGDPTVPGRSTKTWWWSKIKVFQILQNVYWPREWTF